MASATVYSRYFILLLFCSMASFTQAQIDTEVLEKVEKPKIEKPNKSLPERVEEAAEEGREELVEAVAVDSTGTGADTVDIVEEEVSPFEVPYGNNDAVGKYISVNGIGMYYEVYGKGEPLLLIHGNGGDILSMGYQIEHFAKNYRVIVADSRGHGNSELGTNNLNYVQMADDWAALVERLKLDSVQIVGWSDGGIIALLMAINHPEKVKKLVAMGANLQPDKDAIYDWAYNWVRKLNGFIEQKIAEDDTSKDWFLIKQQMDLLRTQPDISLEDLQHIEVPVLIMAGDNDIIREEHTVLMYQNIPNAHLCIFPGETHFIPATDPDLFNSMVERFLEKPFTRPTSKELMFKQ